MREMKNSGIEWLEDIPSHWKIMPNKRIMKKKKELCPTYQGEDILSLTMNGVIVRDLTAGGKMPTTFDGYQRLTAGNLLMCLFDIDVTPRCIGLIRNDGLSSPAYSQFVLNEKGYSPYYYYYYLNLDHTKELLHMAKNLRHSLTEDQLGEIGVPVPPYEEQVRIVTALEDKLPQVDALIANVQAQIEKLKMYKQSVITEVVTRGLNQSVPMKSSGVEWIGEIPEHWNIKRLKFVTTLKHEKWTSDYPDAVYIGLEHIESGSGNRIITDSIYDREQAVLFDEGNILFGKLRPYLAKVYICQEAGCCSSEFCVFELGDELIQRYAWSVLISQGFIDQVNFSTYGTKMPRANADFIQNMYIPVPPKDEQEQIAELIGTKCAQIDQLIAIKQKKIDKLSEYKKSIIYEYVTGKKEVV